VTICQKNWKSAIFKCEHCSSMQCQRPKQQQYCKLDRCSYLTGRGVPIPLICRCCCLNLNQTADLAGGGPLRLIGGATNEWSRGVKRPMRASTLVAGFWIEFWVAAVGISTKPPTLQGEAPFAWSAELQTSDLAGWSAPCERRHSLLVSVTFWLSLLVSETAECFQISGILLNISKSIKIYPKIIASWGKDKSKHHKQELTMFVP